VTANHAGENAMKRTCLVFGAVLAAAMSAGCERDFYARQIVTHNTSSGRMWARMTGSGEELLQQKRIDLHRRMTMRDGTEIDVWVIKPHAEKPAPSRGTAVLLHGLTESKAQYLSTGRRLSEMGYHVVLIDLPAHGDSGGRYVTFGAVESRDVKAVLDALIGAALVSKDVYAYGLTLGAATAIQYAALDSRCRGVVALNPYRDARSKAQRMIGLGRSEEQFDADLARAGEIAGFKPEAASCVAAAARLTCPLLVVCGFWEKADAEAIVQAAGGPKRLLVLVPGPEQAALVLSPDRWIAEKIDLVASGGLGEEAAPATRPARAPTSRPAAGG